ncbi:Uncharacterised protein [Mycobacteroides abscessus subsp. abscessus]|nr:Uncharacterised protein [Mycobacteroides abscessus subsp. abscessus]
MWALPGEEVASTRSSRVASSPRRRAARARSSGFASPDNSSSIRAGSSIRSEVAPWAGTARFSRFSR